MNPSLLGPALALFFLTLAPPLPQTTIPAPSRDAQAVSILQQAIRAMGGAAPTDSTATGTITITAGSSTQSGSIQLLTRGTDQSLESIQATGFNTKIVYSKGLASRTDGGGTKLLEAELSVTSQSAVFPLPLLSAALQNPDVSITLVGQEMLDGLQTYHLRLLNTFTSSPEGRPLAEFSARDLWVDSTTDLPRRLAYVIREARGPVFPIRVQLTYSNYQVENGVSFPLSIQKNVDGVPYATIAITSVALNTGLTDSAFPLQ